MTLEKKIILAGAAVFLAAALLAAANSLWSIFAAVDVPEQMSGFAISPGESVKKISRRLREKNLIRNDFWFRSYVWLVGKEGLFLAGSFDLPPAISAFDLVSFLTNNAKRNVSTIKILEGWTVKDIADYFASLRFWQAEEILSLIGSPGVNYPDSAENTLARGWQADFPILETKPRSAGLEGYLFPDTYEIFPPAGPRAALRKILANFEKKVGLDLQAEIKRQNKNFYDALIVASIVEAEVPADQDRRIVAQILWARLSAGIPLQSDATLNYLLPTKTARLSLKELAIDSPYNSYKYKGLPPTPIGNPGLSAIKAAVFPAATDYLYFLSTPAGETIFSRALSEHNQAKARYLR